jgi:hypothetical protein
MGRAKEAMIEHEGNLAAAASYLVQIGSLQQCQSHHEIYGGGFWDLAGR